jgi:hypothetical protein
MMYALLDGDKGLFLRSPLGEVISSHTFDPNSNSNFDDTSPAAHKTVCSAVLSLLLPFPRIEC